MREEAWAAHGHCHGVTEPSQHKGTWIQDPASGPLLANFPLSEAHIHYLVKHTLILTAVDFCGAIGETLIHRT